MKNKIGCVIPVYRHFAYLLKILPDLLKYFSPECVVIVNDGSEEFDESELKILFPNIDLAHHEENRGKGAALVTGLKKLSKKGFNQALCMDGDGQHSPHDIPFFLKEAGKADILIGKRLFSLGNMPIDRILSNRITSAMIRLLSGLPVKDSQNGFRLVNIEAILNMDLSEDGFQYESEMLILAGRQKLSLINIPVRTIYNNAGSSIHHFSDTWKFIKMIIKNV